LSLWNEWPTSLRDCFADYHVKLARSFTARAVAPHLEGARLRGHERRDSQGGVLPLVNLLGWDGWLTELDVLSESLGPFHEATSCPCRNLLLNPTACFPKARSTYFHRLSVTTSSISNGFILVSSNRAVHIVLLSRISRKRRCDSTWLRRFRSLVRNFLASSR